MKVQTETRGAVMAKKKKRGGKRKSGGNLGDALKNLEVVEKDVAKVRDNLRTYIRTVEKQLSGGSHKLHTSPGHPKKKTPTK
jgi:hypothetical protein